jgi:hypothetical protein
MIEEQLAKGEGKQTKALKNKVKRPKVLAINNINQSLHKTFVDLAKSRHIYQSQLFTEAFNHYLNFRFELDGTESSIMQEAYAIAPNTLGKKIKKMVLRYAEYLISLKDKPEAPVNTKVKNSAKAADARADALIEQIFTNNNDAKHWYDKVLITKTSILDYAAKQKAADPDTIISGKLVLDRCLERHKEQIKQHHAEHGLTPNHNAIAHYERLKATKGDNS